MNLQNSLEKINSKNCIIEIFGLGYVGFPLLVKLAISGFKLVGIDKDSDKLKRIEREELVESELNLKKEFLEVLHTDKISLSQQSNKSDKARLAIICVPTPIPSTSTKSDVFVIEAIENFLENAKNGDIIIIESSIEVGITDKMKEIINSKGFIVGKDIGLSFCPERIDPQNKKWQLENIPRIIYCSDDLTFEICKVIYSHINNSNLKRVNSAKVAEVVKSFENTFRLVNISLVNELAILCDKLGINVKDVLEAASTKPFGFMPFYPSAGAGGHCIPKDPRFLLESAKKHGLDFSTLQNALRVNTIMPKYVVDSVDKMLTELKLEKSVIICGLSYKPDIEDMRDSPGFKILKEFRAKGYKIVACDPYFKQEMQEKYLIENNMVGIKFDVIPNLEDKNIKGFSCLCLVQNHTKQMFRINKIYRNAIIPFIYDCQRKLVKNFEAKTVLKSLGSSFFTN